MSNLRKLSMLDLSNNNFHGQLHEFSNVSFFMLEKLDLSGNNFEGWIPQSIFHFRSLNVLQLSSNNFNGTLKLDAIKSLANITILDLSYNNLILTRNPTISFNTAHKSSLKSLCNKPTLLVLDVSHNHFNGTIPECLTQNKFHGNIPVTFSASCALRTLDVNENLLEGPVTNSLANWTSLEALNLGNNHLNGGFSMVLKEVIKTPCNGFEGKPIPWSNCMSSH
ncbi:hypothetical protein JHK85_051831 [Glycine max]|nr:hypothetical protein JHK85_051831 [Glycine max]